jgi:hypothetical protein
MKHFVTTQGGEWKRLFLLLSLAVFPERRRFIDVLSVNRTGLQFKLPLKDRFLFLVGKEDLYVKTCHG